MRSSIAAFLILFISNALYAQEQKYIDSLQNVFNTSKLDSAKVNAAHALFLENVRYNF